MGARCEMPDGDGENCRDAAVATVLAYGNYYGASDVHVCERHAHEPRELGYELEPVS